MDSDDSLSVLQLNVRLSEGGAAGVARNLSSELEKRGHKSRLAYGFSRRGGASPLEGSLDALRVTPRPIAIANTALFPYTGDETRLRGPASWHRLREAVDAADVVHFHAVHSHLARVEDLVQLCRSMHKPLVWTMHDHWLFTGRCAQPGLCRRYLDGCQSCPDLRAYPPARLDRARQHWPTRRSLLEQLQSSGVFQLVSCASWLQGAAIEAGLPPTETITNSIDRALMDELTTASMPVRSRRCRVLFLCRDLRDRVKVDWRALSAISQLDGVDLTIVGDHGKGLIPPGVTHHSATGDRKRLAELMLSHDVLLFTSRVDYYPLTIAESLSAGMLVLAYESEATSEFAEFPVRVAKNGADLVQLLADVRLNLSSIRDDRGRRMKLALTEFSPDRMVEKYLSVYRRLAR